MSWPEHRLDELGSVARGRSRHRPRDAAHLYGGQYPFVQTGDVKHAGLYLTDYQQTYSEDGLAQSRLWPAGTLCITIAANIADTAILGIDACFPDSVIGFIPDPDKADARFVKYLFDAALKKRYSAFTQGAAQDNLSQGKLLSLTFPVPDLGTQQNLAEVLSSYDQLIENNRRRIELLEQSAHELYKEWFVRFRFPGHEHVNVFNGLPEGWEACTVGDLLTLQRGFDLPVKERKPGNVPIYASTGINGYHNAIKVEGPGVVTGRSGSLGTVMFVSRDFWPLNTTLWVKEFKRIDSYFAVYLLRSLNLQSLNAGAAVPTLNRNNVHPIKIALPPETLRNAFTEFIDPVFRQAELLTTHIEKLMQARDLLLPKLMSGELAA